MLFLLSMKVLTTGEAARLLNISADMVRYLARTGRLPAEYIGTTGRTRIFRLDDVQKLARDRGDLEPRDAA